MTDLPDIQITEPQIKIPINQVGVNNIEVPFTLESKYGGFKQMVAKVSMTTNLNNNTKGISMSRLLLTLKPYLDLPLKHKLIKKIMEDLNKNIGSINSFIRFDFKLPIKRKSPKSNNQFPIYHNCKFEMHYNSVLKKFRFFQGVKFQYASYCPCSAELSKDLFKNGSIGFPHAQRSFVYVNIEVEKDKYIWLEDIIETLEKSIKTLPFPIIKRVDEQLIAEIAAKNPIFVEDAIRSISKNINSMFFIKDWHIHCVHQESIHTSNAIATNWKGVKGGFDEKYKI